METHDGGHNFADASDKTVSSVDVISSFAEGIFSTLIEPLTVSAFPDNVVSELKLMKKKADLNVMMGLNEIFGANIADVSCIQSVFETPGFFNDVLESLQWNCRKKYDSTQSDIEPTVMAEKSLTHESDHETIQIPEKTDKNNCTLFSGHLALDPNISSKVRVSYCSDEKCEVTNKNLDLNVTTIDKQTTTSGKNNILDVNNFITQTSFSNVKTIIPMPDLKKHNEGLSQFDLPNSSPVNSDNSKSSNILNLGSKEVFLPFMKSVGLSLNESKKDFYFNSESLNLSQITSSLNDEHISEIKKSLEIINATKTQSTNSFRRESDSSHTIVNSNSYDSLKSTSKFEKTGCDSVSLDFDRHSCINEQNRSLEFCDSFSSRSKRIKGVRRKGNKVRSKKRNKKSKENRKVKLMKDRKSSECDLSDKEDENLSAVVSPPPGVDLEEYLEQQLFYLKAKLKNMSDEDSNSDDCNEKEVNESVPLDSKGNILHVSNESLLKPEDHQQTSSDTKSSHKSTGSVESSKRDSHHSSHRKTSLRCTSPLSVSSSERYSCLGKYKYNSPSKDLVHFENNSSERRSKTHSRYESSKRSRSPGKSHRRSRKYKRNSRSPLDYKDRVKNSSVRRRRSRSSDRRRSRSSDRDHIRKRNVSSGHTVKTEIKYKSVVTEIKRISSVIPKRRRASDACSLSSISSNDEYYSSPINRNSAHKILVPFKKSYK